MISEEQFEWLITVGGMQQDGLSWTEAMGLCRSTMEMPDECLQLATRKKEKRTSNNIIQELGGILVKQVINKNWKRDELIARKRQGRKKTVSHGSYRAKRKPNSPRVTLEEHLKAKATL